MLCGYFRYLLDKSESASSSAELVVDHANIAVVGRHPHWLPPDSLILVLVKLNLDIVIDNYLQLSKYLCGPDLVLAAPLVAD